MASSCFFRLPSDMRRAWRLFKSVKLAFLSLKIGIYWGMSSLISERVESSSSMGLRKVRLLMLLEIDFLFSLSSYLVIVLSYRFSSASCFNFSILSRISSTLRYSWYSFIMASRVRVGRVRSLIGLDKFGLEFSSLLQSSV